MSTVAPKPTIAEILTIDVGLTRQEIAKATGLSADATISGLFALGPAVRCEDNKFFKVIVKERKTGPRGPTNKCARRLMALEPVFLKLAAEKAPWGISATDLEQWGEDHRDELGETRWVYSDIQVVRKHLLAEGKIKQIDRGRKAFWVPADALTTETPATESAPADEVDVSEAGASEVEASVPETTETV